PVRQCLPHTPVLEVPVDNHRPCGARLALQVAIDGLAATVFLGQQISYRIIMYRIGSARMESSPGWRGANGRWPNWSRKRVHPRCWANSSRLMQAGRHYASCRCSLTSRVSRLPPSYPTECDEKGSQKESKPNQAC